MHDGFVIFAELAKLMAAPQQHSAVDRGLLGSVRLLVGLPKHHVEPLCEGVVLLPLPISACSGRTSNHTNDGTSHLLQHSCTVCTHAMLAAQHTVLRSKS